MSLVTSEMRSNPYTSQGSTSFWKTGVEHRQGETFPAIWKPKLAITPETSIVTAGSCFAQHISRWLIAHDYSWLDSEPAPEGLTDEEIAEGGYGIFSFRTGNIYSAALLRQWVSWALGLEEQVFDTAVEDGRYFDLLRPAFPRSGHASQADLESSRSETLAAFRRALLEADVFIFTLGLTEAWRHTSGYVYPLCPGTAHGEFDPKLHHFVNYGFAEIKRDLEATFDAIRMVNPSIGFLLTVSPVPLTATAGDDHILPATIYSKSVLRAVAGALRDEQQGVDYFPSYELVAAHPTQGSYYDANLRTVRPEGVNFVMAHFGIALGVHASSGSVADAEVFCEESALEKEAWDPGATDEVPPLLLVGSSHMKWLSAALAELEVPHLGGYIMNGSGWHRETFVQDEESFFVPLESRDSRARWEQALPFFDVPPRPEHPKQIITDLCVHTHMLRQDFHAYLVSHGVDVDSIARYIAERHTMKLVLLQRWLEAGYHVMVVLDAPTGPTGWTDLQKQEVDVYQHVLRLVLRGVGVDIFATRDEFGAEWDEARYTSLNFEANGNRDWVHGSEDFYHDLAERLIGRMERWAKVG